MKNYIKYLLVMLLIFLSTAFGADKDLSLAPDFNLKEVNGDTISLTNYKDKQPVVLFFWTTWCPFCRDELRSLRNIYPDIKKDGVELLAINIRESDYKVSNFIKNYGLPFRVLLDKDSSAAYAYGVLGVPTYIFIDKKGRVIFTQHSFSQEKYKSLISK